MPRANMNAPALGISEIILFSCIPKKPADRTSWSNYMASSLKYSREIVASSVIYRLLHHNRPKPLSSNSRLAAPSMMMPSPSTSDVELPLLICFDLLPLPTNFKRSVITIELNMDRHRIPTMTRVLFLYCCFPGLLSATQPVKSAYVVKIEPRFPQPDTTADAAATPTSP